MRKFLASVLLLLMFVSVMPNVAESMEAEEQAVEVARTGLIHGQLSIQSLSDMIKYFEHAITISDGSTKFSDQADKVIVHAKKALIELKKALQYAEQISNN
ncbi:MAG: hypothetical protein ACE5IH_00045 [Thermodesulfobacteriota bacterium]